MHHDGRHPGLRKFQESRAQQRRIRELKAEIQKQNPTIEPGLLDRVAKAKAEKEAYKAPRPVAHRARKHRSRPDTSINSLAMHLKHLK